NTYQGTTTISAGILRVTGGAAIADTSAVSMGAGTTLDVVRSETIGSLAGEGAVTLASGQWLTAGGDNSSTTFSGVISGAGELIKAGSGTLTLSGANTYAGATTVSNGTLDVTGSIASSEIFLFSTGTLQVNGTALSDTATVRLDDASTLRLTGSATIGTLGGTNGTVDLGTHTLTLSAGSSFYNGLVSGTGGVTVTGGTQGLAGSNTFTGAVNVTGGSLGLNGVASTVAGVSGGSLTGVLSSATGLTISDTGTFRSTSDQTIASVTQTGGMLTGTRTLTVLGDYALRGGEVTTSGAPPLVVNAGTFTMSGGTIAGTLGGTGATTVQTGTVTIAGTGQIVGDVTLASGTLRLEGNTGVTGSITTTGSVVDLADGVNSTVPIVIDSDTTQVQVATGTATQSGVISETGGARPLEKIGDGTLILSGANTYTGLTTISAGTLRLTGGAAIADTGAVSLTAGTTLRVDQSETIGALTNLGTVDLSTGNGTADTVLTVNGNSAAAAGSVLRIDTMLGDDSAMSDRVVIAGDTSGTTSVFVNVTGGDAAQTTSGILLVDVAGASDGTFVLANGDTTLPDGAAAISTPGGVFLYTLRQSGGDWLLQSQLTAVSVVYEALPSTLLGLMQSQTLAQRLSGQRMLTDGSGDEGGGTFSSRGRVPTTPEVGAWLDIRAAQLDVTPGASTTGLSWDQRSWRTEAGIDTVLHETMGGMLVGGISLTKGSGRVDAVSAIGAGRIDTDAVGIGLSATWYGTGGFYADVELGWQDFESDLSTPGIGVLATGVGGKGHYASVEIGQSLAMGNLTLIPQAELSWTKVSLDGFTGAGGLAVAQSEAESRKLRLGLAAERNWLTGNGGAAQVYGIATSPANSGATRRSFLRARRFRPPRRTGRPISASVARCAGRTGDAKPSCSVRSWPPAASAAARSPACPEAWGCD
ncbi:MAG: autotransporter outer membrane beta-barrel domain-containing protein, partial [Proteobacteria bacterium]|nr:autotransporter outer membrane beta-barrel domain-containing protein [Pseudomonadota bacterium]